MKRSTRLSCIRRLLAQQDGRCFYCERSITEADASLDHLIPLSAGGGGLAAANLVVCCHPINHFLGNAPFEVKIEILSDSDFLRSLSRWCLVVDSGTDRR